MGRPDVDVFLEELTAEQLKMWWEFDKIEPIGVEAHLLGHAITASTLANVNRDSKKKKEPFSPADFMPEFIKPKDTKESKKSKLVAETKKFVSDFLSLVGKPK